METYKIYGSHFIEGVEKIMEFDSFNDLTKFIDNTPNSEVMDWLESDLKIIRAHIRLNLNYYFADDASFDAYSNILKSKGWKHIVSFRNIETDGHGNVILYGDKIVPARFYKGANKNEPIRMDSLRKKSSTTESGINRTWIITCVEKWIDDSGIYDRNGFLSGKGKGGKYSVPSTINALMVTEATARAYIKNHPNQANWNKFKAYSMIDYLSLE